MACHRATRGGPNGLALPPSSCTVGIRIPSLRLPLGKTNVDNPDDWLTPLVVAAEERGRGSGSAARADAEAASAFAEAEGDVLRRALRSRMEALAEWSAPAPVCATRPASSGVAMEAVAASGAVATTGVAPAVVGARSSARLAAAAAKGTAKVAAKGPAKGAAKSAAKVATKGAVKGTIKGAASVSTSRYPSRATTVFDDAEGIGGLPAAVDRISAVERPAGVASAPGAAEERTGGGSQGMLRVKSIRRSRAGSVGSGGGRGGAAGALGPAWAGVADRRDAYAAARWSSSARSGSTSGGGGSSCCRSLASGLVDLVGAATLNATATSIQGARTGGWTDVAPPALWCNSPPVDGGRRLGPDEMMDGLAPSAAPSADAAPIIVPVPSLRRSSRRREAPQRDDFTAGGRSAETKVPRRASTPSPILIPTIGSAHDLVRWAGAAGAGAAQAALTALGVSRSRAV